MSDLHTSVNVYNENDFIKEKNMSNQRREHHERMEGRMRYIEEENNYLVKTTLLRKREHLPYYVFINYKNLRCEAYWYVTIKEKLY